MHNIRAAVLFLACSILLLSPSLATAQSSPERFDSFYSRFKQAVAQRDSAALQQMMSTSFDFLTTANVSPLTVFTSLDSNNGQLWLNLQTATQQATPVLDEYADHPAQLLWCTPTQTIYNCYVVFQKNKSSQWRWRGFVMPEK